MDIKDNTNSNNIVGNNNTITNTQSTEFLEQRIYFLEREIILKDKEIEARDRDIEILKGMFEENQTLKKETEKFRLMVDDLYERKIKDLKKTH